MGNKLHFDIFGKLIKKGDFVVFGVRSGNSGDIRVGIVLEGNADHGHDERVRVHSARSRWDDNGFVAAAKHGDAKPNAMFVLDTHGVPREAQNALGEAYDKYWAKKDAK